MSHVEERDEQAEGDLTSLGRTRTMTERGLDYKKELLQKEFKRSCCRWKQRVIKLEADCSEDTLDALNQSIQDLEYTYERILDVLELEELEDIEIRYDNILAEHREISRKANRILREMKEESSGSQPGSPDRKFKSEPCSPKQGSLQHRSECAEDSKTDTSRLFMIQKQQVDSMQDLIGKFSETLSCGRLPTPEPTMFAGDPMKYNEWRTSFNLMVDRLPISNEEKLFYLKKYVTGAARETVEGHFMVSSSQSYPAALETLDKRYGSPYIVADAFRERLKRWPKIQPKDGNGLRKLSDFLKQCQSAMQSVPSLEILNDERENEKILEKLPDWLIIRWTRIVVGHRESDRYPSFDVFAKFLEEESKVATDRTRRLTQKPATPPKSSFGVTSKTQPPHSNDRDWNGVKSCIMCDGAHGLDKCPNFLSLRMEQRHTYIKNNFLCFKCLKKYHISKDCRNKMTCEVCGQKHPTSLHEYRSTNTSTDGPSTDGHVTSSVVGSVYGANVEQTSMIVPVWVSHRHDTSREVLVYAMLDTQSDSTFALQSLTDNLGVQGVPTKLRLSTITGREQPVEMHKISGLMVRAFSGEKRFQLPSAYTREEIPVNRAHIPTPLTAESWKHLEFLNKELLPLNNADVGLLIGYDCPEVITPREVIPAPLNNNRAPFAIKTVLGWSIVGKSGPKSGGTICHRIQTTTRELPPDEVLQVLESDFTPEKSCVPISLEDQKFISLMDSSIRNVNGKYEMPLPFRHDAPELPNNRSVSLKRAQQLKRKLQRDDGYHKDYTASMEQMLERGYCEEVVERQNESDVWYIPHHGVFKAHSSKLRIVFDCSVTYQGRSLNNSLLSGPDLINSLIGILCRFRKEPFAITCDIEQMFHQFSVIPSHRDYLRFLWWPEDRLDSKIKAYRMTVHLFGATSSPGCANFALKRIAQDHREEFGSAASDFLRKNFYVDDGLASVATEDKAIDLMAKTKDLCAAGGLRLHKIASNSKSVLSQIQPEDRCKDIGGSSTIEKTLGVYWCLENDTLHFRITLQSRSPTRRNILSTVCSIFDPLGMVAPVILSARRILQELCAMKLDWDEDIPEKQRQEWDRWQTGILELEGLSVERCYKRNIEGEPKIELHHFSDASSYGYGEVSYIRLVTKDTVECSFVFGKARVASLKPITIPRLELMGAVLSTTVSQMLARELDYDNMEQYFWCDSQVVLGYIRNTSKRFHVFVANRIQVIHERSSPAQWRHVSGSDNPADEASRGISARDLLTNSRWLKGPDFLYSRCLPETQREILIEDDDPEIKSHVFSVKTDHRVLSLTDRLTRFSSWTLLCRSVAWCIRYIQILRHRVKGTTTGNFPKGILSVDEVKQAETRVLKHAQNDGFSEEISFLCQHHNKDSKPQDSSNVKTLRGSPLKKLAPYVDPHGMLRVGGRLKCSEYPESQNHPLILPKRHHVSAVLIRHHHELVSHQGRGLTLNSIRRAGIWIIGGVSRVAKCIHDCVVCKRMFGRVLEQQMADLPRDRLEVAPPFSFCGVDLFGPWYIKEHRKELKRYGVIFTCLCSRAVHIETTVDLSTDSFLNALRRFQALRGPLRLLRSDQGTNFIGADNKHPHQPQRG